MNKDEMQKKADENTATGNVAVTLDEDHPKTYPPKPESDTAVVKRSVQDIIDKMEHALTTDEQIRIEALKCAAQCVATYRAGQGGVAGSFSESVLVTAERFEHFLQTGKIVPLSRKI
jgi:hypothetical protein